MLACRTHYDDFEFDEDKSKDPGWNLVSDKIMKLLAINRYLLNERIRWLSDLLYTQAARFGISMTFPGINECFSPMLKF